VRAEPRVRLSFSTAEEFSRLVSPELPGMLRAARAILESEDLAWDAVQETLLRVWRLGELGRGAVLRHLCRLSALHLARCRRRRSFHEERASLAEHCCAQDPLADVASSELRRSLRAALARMTRRYREVFELYEFHGRDYREIAAVLDVPIGTVRSRLARARRELRGQLGHRGAATGPSS
jgi:RNA polymerase sigma-70 factor (ECF subfamily)